ncbi:MAG TPA: endopeptidase La [Bdellovibrionales bacterium]|nr:endopeptidase La [Bdellovibrionales bacterium]
MESTLFNKPIPVLALRNLVLFPGTTVPIRVGRAQSIAAIRQLKKEAGDREVSGQLIAVLQKPIDQKEHIAPDELHKVGVLAQIERVRGNDKDGYQLVVRGIERVAVATPFETAGVLKATPEPFKEERDADPATLKALLDSLKTTSKQILELLPSGTDQMVTLVDGINDLDFMISVVASNVDLQVEAKQELIEQKDLKARALHLLDLLQHVRDELQVRTEIRDKLTSKLGKSQREAILREQMRQIQEELGDVSGEGGNGRPEDLRKKIEDAGMPDNVKKLALDELRRLESLGQQSPETHVIRNYLDLLISMPWKVDEEPEIDLKKAREVLDHDHYGLDKIKKRIIEHLATMKLKEGGRGLILLFNGPPGVGKTSLGQSIAHALGRKFVRVSLGGVRDDAEIRGHRRTYIGAMPGRIIQGIKRAGSMNPVFLLDEVDKLGRGFQGDPSAALLEVLDPEQNATFTDHYMDVPYDLSKVLFIATANSLETIPGPLLDRMEVIELNGYTTNEKLHIAMNHLVEKQKAEHGIKKEQLDISDEAMLFLITHYTREAGVRDLQRKIAALCRAATTKIVEGAEHVKIAHRIDESLSADQDTNGTVLIDIEEALGPVRFEHEVAEKITPPGVTTGLAWTPVGGEILFIESALMPGSGKLTLTGQLGDVMKESAQIALTLIRSRIPAISAALEFEKRDLHIHVPAGAIPKDGPSAGVAILTSIASLFTGRPVDPKLAMTGEVTLRGAVTPVGGIKEKVIAAHRAGVTRVILARKNERDLKDVPDEVKEKLRFYFVDDVGEVLRVSLGLEIPAMDPNTGLWGFAQPRTSPPPSA